MIRFLLKQTLLRLSIFIGLVALLAFMLVFALHGTAETGLVIHNETNVEPAAPYQSLRILSANIGHGRTNATHQMMQSMPSIQNNLTAITKLAQSHHPNLIALQDADDHSFWSGSFNHVEELGTKNDLSWIQGGHVAGLGLRYGTAILSAIRMDNAASHTFPVTPPTFSKGFVVCTLSGTDIDVVSVSLSAGNQLLWKRQLKHLIRKLEARGNRVVLCCDVRGPQMNAVIADLAARLDLNIAPHEGESNGWILADKDFEIRYCEILEQTVAGSHPLFAEIDLNLRPPERRVLGWQHGRDDAAEQIAAVKTP